MREFFGAYLTSGPVGLVMSGGALTIRGVWAMGMFKAVERCFFPGWQTFSNLVLSCYPGGSHLVIVCTGLSISYTYEQNTWKLLLPARYCETPM